MKKNERMRMIAGVICLCAGGQGVLMNSASVFMKPVSDALGFLRGDFALYTSITMIAVMVLMPVFATQYAKPYFKKLMLACAVTSALVPICYSVSAKLWQFYAFSAVLGVSLNGVSMQVATNIINNWFSESKGTVLGLSYAGSSLGAAGMVMLAGLLIDRFGWQYGYIAMAASSGLLLMASMVLLKGFAVAPKPSGDEAVAVTAEASIHGIRGILRSLRNPVLLLLVLAGFLMCLSGGSLMNNAVAYASDHGHGAAVLSVMASLTMLLSAGAKILMGLIVDRLGQRAGLFTMFTGMALAFTFLMLIDLPFAPYIIPFGQAFTMTGGVVLGLVASSSLKREQFAFGYSVMSSMFALGMALSSPIPGMIYDHTGTYVPAWIMAIGCYSLVVVCVLLAMRLSKRQGVYHEA